MGPGALPPVFARQAVGRDGGDPQVVSFAAVAGKSL
jgi:hypothetical protein